MACSGRLAAIGAAVLLWVVAAAMTLMAPNARAPRGADAAPTAHDIDVVAATAPPSRWQTAKAPQRRKPHHRAGPQPSSKPGPPPPPRLDSPGPNRSLEHARLWQPPGGLARHRQCYKRFEGDFIGSELRAVRERPSLKFARQRIQHHRDYFAALRCIGLYYDVEAIERLGAASWEARAPNASWHPVLVPMHGGVVPSRLVQQSEYLARVGGVTDALRAANATSASDIPDPLDPSTVIVELGGGNGGLLFAMCPPSPRVACYCADFAPGLLRHGAEHQPHIDFALGARARHVPSGAATLSVSHAVMTYLNEEQACEHLDELLRVLRPGGRALVYMLRATWQSTRYHPGFFSDKAGAAADDPDVDHVVRTTVGSNGTARSVLPFCPLLGQYVADISVVLNDTTAVIYTPEYHRHATFAVTVTRSDAPYNASGANATDAIFPTALNVTRLRAALARGSDAPLQAWRRTYADALNVTTWPRRPRRKRR